MQVSETGSTPAFIDTMADFAVEKGFGSGRIYPPLAQQIKGQYKSKGRIEETCQQYCQLRLFSF
jgi:hypothetical protein